LARLIVVASVLLLVASGFPAFALAQESSDPLQVDLVPVGDASVSGLALLSPSGDATAVQLLVMGAAAGTAAMIHRGTCDDINPAPIALLGDVGAAGQIQTTAPVAYATLASGGYLIALHSGLSDLATAIACGEIPAVDLPPDPTATPVTEPVRSTTYTSPTFGYSFSWDDTWTVVMQGSTGGDDFIMLSRPGANLLAQGTEAFGDDTAECLSDSEARLRGSPDAEDVVPFDGVRGQSAAGTDVNSAWATFAYTSTKDDASTGRRIEFYRCYRLTETATLAVLHTAFESDYAEEAIARDAVLATLTLSGQPPVPTAVPSAVATDVPLPTPSVEPTPTPASDSCAGLETWLPPTYRRVDRMIDLIDQARLTPAGTLRSFWSSARGEITAMVELQRSQPVPPFAVDINNRIIEILDAEIDLLNRSIELIETDPGNAAALVAITQESEANASIVASLAGELKSLARECGFPVPD
jgi:hypothetical protein